MGSHGSIASCRLQVEKKVHSLIKGLSANTNYFFDAQYSTSNGVVLHATGSMKKDVSVASII